MTDKKEGLPRSEVQSDEPKRVTGCVSLVEEAACLIWDELCPGMVMGDSDLPHYEAAARAVLALPHPAQGARRTPLDIEPAELNTLATEAFCGAAQGSGDCGAIILDAIPVDEWPKEIDERVLIYVVHPQAQYEADEAKRKAEWEGWHVGYWSDFNKGGWVWHGMLGTATHVAPLPASPSVPSAERK